MDSPPETGSDREISFTAWEIGAAENTLLAGKTSSIQQADSSILANVEPLAVSGPALTSQDNFTVSPFPERKD